MSAFIFDVDSRIVTSNNAINSYTNGLPFDSDGALVVTDGTGAPNNIQNGWPFESDGSLAIHDGGTISSYTNGLPFTSEGRLATDGVNAVAAFSNGYPLASGGVGMASLGVRAFSYETESQTFFTAALAAGAEPSDQRKLTYNRLVKRLKDEGIWTKLTHLWVLAAATSAASRINLINPGTNDCTLVGTPTFTANDGWVGSGTVNHLDTGVTLASIPQDNHSLGVYTPTFTTGVSGTDFGAVDGSSRGVFVRPKDLGTSQFRAASMSTATIVGTQTEGNGFFAVTRNGAASFNAVRDGTTMSTPAVASVANVSATTLKICFLGGAAVASSSKVVSMAFLGAYLTEAELRELYGAFLHYYESVNYGEFYTEDPGIGTSSITADIVVYGCTSGAVTAAYEAARQGKTVAVIGGWRDRRMGGMSAGGLGSTDFDNHAGLGGLSRWIITKFNSLYSRADTTFSFEPKYYTRAIGSLLDPTRNGGYNIPVYYTRGVSAVDKTGAAITAIYTLDGRTVNGSVFIDTSYEGDLAKIAGVTMTKGREAAGTGFEALNGYRGIVTSDNGSNHQFKRGATLINVDPYNTPGVSASGLLPGLSRTYVAGTPALGSADSEIQAYNFRLSITNNTARMIPFPSTPPVGYSATDWEPLGRLMAAEPLVAITDLFLINDLTVNSSYDFNSKNGWSTDFWGGSKLYPESTYSARETLWKAHWNRILGLWYYLQYDPDVRVLASVRTAALAYGLSSSHYPDHHENDNAFDPPQLYVREAWRMVSDMIWDGNDILATDGTTPRSVKTISTASYSMDSHSTEAIADPNAGTPRIWCSGNFERAMTGNQIGPIPYDIIVPKAADCTNLLVTFAISATHVAFGSIRMEFTSMQMAQSAAVAAKLAIDGATTVQAVDYTALRAAILATPTLVGEVAPVLPVLN